MILEIILPPELREFLENDDNLSIAEIDYRDGEVRIILYDKRQKRFDYWSPTYWGFTDGTITAQFT